MGEHERWRSRGYLPHIDAGLRPQFLTWRLDDSVPADLVEQWRSEIALLFEKDSDRIRELYSRLEGYLDQGHGSCILRNQLAAIIVQDALIFHHEQQYELHEWVVMPNHLQCCYRRAPMPAWREFCTPRSPSRVRRFTRGSEAKVDSGSRSTLTVSSEMKIISAV